MVRALALVVVCAGCQVGSPEAAPGAAVEPVTAMQVAAARVPTTSDGAAPWTLTASDGSGLMLTRVDAKAVVQGPLAFTELHLYFHNAEPRVREGTFAITLPAGAAVSRFAKERDGQWQEAEVVEKALARRAYDDFLHRKQDPALLEKTAGNQFTAKVFPIAASADTHLVVSFSQELIGRAYTLPMRGLPEVERVDVKLSSLGADGAPHEQTLGERNWRPDRDFVSAIPSTAAGVTDDGMVVVALPYQAAQQTRVPLEEVTVLVDTSASRGLGFTGYVRRVHELIVGLAALGATHVQVIGFDQDREELYEGPPGGYTDAALIARGAAGASNLAQALGGSLRRRVVVITDGVNTAGPEPEVAKLRIDRLDVVLAGGIRDERFAATIARGLPQAGDVFDLDRGVDEVVRGLGQQVATDVEIRVAGATWSYPRTVPAARPGSPLVVYAKLATPTRTIDVALGNTHATLRLGSATPALIERAIAGAEIEELEDQLAKRPDDKELREDIATRSVKARVISSQTSMLVLESDRDFERYHIARNGLADILTIGPRGIEQSKRKEYLAKADPQVEAQRQQAIAAAAHAERARQPKAELDRAAAIDQARNAGVLGSSGSFASLDGTADISSGFDDADLYGGLLGDQVGESEGAYGYGRAGAGPGGGGQGWGTIGTGRYGTVGRGTGAGYGVGGGRGGMRGRAASVPSVSIGQPQVAGDLDRAIVRRYIKRNLAKLQYCYEHELLAHPGLGGTLTARFTIKSDGHTADLGATGVSDQVAMCVRDVIRDIEFPRPHGGAVVVSYPFTLQATGTPPRAPIDVTPDQAPGDDDSSTEDDTAQPKVAPLTGKLAEVTRLLGAGKVARALELATAWHAEAPGDVLALIGLGEALEASHDARRAARIYGSLIDLFPGRADLRRFAGERLERLGGDARALAIDTYRRAVADRPDHLTGHRLLAYALERAGDHAGAFAAILAGIAQKYPGGRFLGGDRVLAEDAAMLGAVWAAHGGAPAEIDDKLAAHGIKRATAPSTRFVLYWETDGNDVDFHIRDARRGHAWYAHKHLRSGGDLYADVTTGYGPECFAIQGKPSAGPYQLSLNYFSQGPMGYGMGLLQIQTFDGTELKFQDRPYVIMVDHAFVDLGTY